MGITRSELIDELRRLKECHGAVCIKAEFEAEGSRKDELIMLREFVDAVDLGFVIKIGGCEAVHDLDQCKLLYASGVMAPMIETPFAMAKYKKAYKKVFVNKEVVVERIINAETKTCLINFQDILDVGEGFLTGVTVGRSDLSSSMGIPKSEIEGDAIFQATLDFIQQSNARGLVTNFGGNIGKESVDTVIRLSKLINRYETRKVVLSPSGNRKETMEAIRSALKFEMKYLMFKSEYYHSMAKEDEERIVRLDRQIRG